jgi:hypothetical protein
VFRSIEQNHGRGEEQFRRLRLGAREVSDLKDQVQCRQRGARGRAVVSFDGHISGIATGKGKSRLETRLWG